MKHIVGSFGSADGINLYYQCWLPDSAPKSILVIVHGLAEHSSRYASTAAYFVSRGYAVYSFDYRGHGKSEGIPGYVERFSHYTDDLRSFINMISENNRNSKITLLGHSMGATISATFAVEHQDWLDGLILSGIVMKIGDSVSPLTIMMGRLISAFFPKMGVTVIDASAISRDNAVVDAYINDPLVYQGKISARLGVELINTIKRLQNDVSKIYLPVLIMHGTCDSLSDPKGSEIFYGSVGSKDRTLKLYEGYYHEVFNDMGKEQVLADTEAWLEEHIKV